MTTDEKTNYRPAAKAAAEDRPCPACRSDDDITLSGPVLRLALVSAYRHPNVARLCYQKKQACYSRFRSAAASIPLADEAEYEHLHLITATDCASQEIVGSVSIYRRGPGSPLPVERAIGGMERLKPEIDSWQGKHIVELSGLWTEELWRKTGISEQLMLVAFAATHELRAEKIVGFSHQHVLEFYATVGLVPDLTLGQYDYPNADYVSTVVWGDPTGFMTMPVEKRPAVSRFAEALAKRQPIYWRNFKERVALER